LLENLTSKNWGKNSHGGKICEVRARIKNAAWALDRRRFPARFAPGGNGAASLNPSVREE
jgi:hypothetical protein